MSPAAVQERRGVGSPRVVGRPAPITATNDNPRSGLALLAAAVSGEPVTVGDLAGGVTYYDGASIRLAPDEPVAQAAATMAQAVLLPSGSFDPVMLAKLRARPVIAHRYFLLEVARSAAALSYVLPSWFTEMVESLIPGPVAQSPEESLSVASGRARLPETVVVFGTLRPTSGLLKSANAAAHGTQQTRRTIKVVESGLQPNDDTERSRILEWFSNPVFGSSLLMKLLGDIGGVRAPRGDKSSGDEGASHDAVYDPVIRRKEMVLVGSRLGGATVESGNETAGYPEWDCNKQDYRRGWCRVRQYDPNPEDPNPLAIQASTGLRRASALLAREFVRRSSEPWGHEVDVDALVERTVRKRAGQGAMQNIYAARLRRRPSLGLMVLVDCSGSAREQAVHREQLVFTAALLDVLHSGGVRASAYGFNSRGRQDIRLIRVKGFDEPYNLSARRRLGNLQPANFTRLGAAVRHSAHLVNRNAGTPQRSLLVVSDGFPFDTGGYEDEYADADSRQALRETRHLGIGCACVSIGSTVEVDRVKRVFGESNHLLDATAAGALQKVMQLLVATVRTTER